MIYWVVLKYNPNLLKNRFSIVQKGLFLLFFWFSNQMYLIRDSFIYVLKLNKS
jgi:hypothetical protein